MRGLSQRWLVAGWLQFNQRFCHNLNPKYEVTRRLCSTKPVILQSIEKKVDPFGKMMIDLPYNVEIKPTNPHEYPDMDTLLVKCFHKGDKVKNKAYLITVNVSAACDKYFDIRAIDNEFDQAEVTCIIEAPVSYGNKLI